MSRSTPQKHQPDAFQRTFAGVFDRLGGAVIAISGVLVLILVAAALVWGFVNWSDKSQAGTWDTIAKAMDERDIDRQITLLEEALKEATGQARAAALLTLAARLHDRAISTHAAADDSRAVELRRPRDLYEEFLRDYPDHRLAVRARANLAGVLEDSRDYAAARAAYERAAEACVDTDFAFMSGELLWGQARCAHQLSQDDQAASLLERALSRKGTAGAGWEGAARVMADQLRSTKTKKSLLVENPTQDEPPPEPPKKEGGAEEPAPKAPGAGKEPPVEPGPAGAKG